MGKCQICKEEECNDKPVYQCKICGKYMCKYCPHHDKDGDIFCVDHYAMNASISNNQNY